MTSLRFSPDLVPLAMQSLAAGFKVSMSLAVDEFGSTVNQQGNSSGIGNDIDLELLKAFRRNADVVLTSGATFRADQYKFPKTADLAVLSTKQPVIQVPHGKRLTWIRSDFVGALSDLESAGYRRIHVEYGLTGLNALRSAGIPLVLFVSSDTPQGLDRFLAKQSIEAIRLELPGLLLAVVAWQ